jgi:hypothetical protein
VSLLPTKFHEILFSSFRGVALTNCDGRTDGQVKNNMSPRELCPFELRNFRKFTTEAACQRNSSETTEQNFMKPGR